MTGDGYYGCDGNGYGGYSDSFREGTRVDFVWVSDRDHIYEADCREFLLFPIGVLCADPSDLRCLLIQARVKL